jgi:hypothetical protein
MNQEGRNSGTCSHAAARHVSVAVILDDAADLFGIQRWTSNVEANQDKHVS